ncbi:hypothetical protein G7068_07790 [Leucobacter viscericola]|uniref:Uncharacterized protein n=1 Tax=Leucobacter viscericola TaxID=2714935 RepID=A0A6G7XEY7_9MICO|nr:hypothetical protein [Leucobacter viscericola]QIK63113.1 hypothetical protein G7068_07790 [Leucobacter viscericola]
MRSGKRTIQRVALGATAAAVALGAVHSIEAPAHAETSPEVIELSSDGASYSRSMSGLFGPVALTPLSSVDESFWVRNAGKAPAYLTIMATNATVSDPNLAAALTLSAGLADTNPAFPLPAKGSCVTLEAGQLLGAGKDVRVSSQLALGNLNGTQGQGAKLDFNLRVMLSDLPLTSVGDTKCAEMPGDENETDGSTKPPTTGVSGGGSGSPGALETTGTELGTLLSWGAVLAALGFAIVAFKRRRRSEEQ